MPFISDRFPTMTVVTTVGTITLPDDYAGRWFVLFSHPADFTPVCTTEFVAFEKMKPQFNEMNTELIGLSVEQVFSHMKWIEWIREKLRVNISFPIIADELGYVAKQLGMIHPTKGTRTVRSVYVVDHKGTIRLMLTYPESVGRNIYEIVRAVKALQTTDAYKAATPANWPHNELVGDRLIMPPPRTIQEAEERLNKAKQGEIDCFDWWFCTKQT
ncbi:MULTISPECIES: peroxiredoxin [Anoxybacillus]|uniref:peroxiredoxin n=1 Tax=Anoxybacillus TaxID=150247 RepID=UPI0007DF493D|nr:peroxiredoxin [Anoxybacillus flavithermus]MBE2905623.1 peroxiredoxin [Anoxybacillus flavithermus]MBE2913821.1 peroxiredoxin [Anoxybacillus flavithermus]MBE2940732.1 peroxiredoxin [Anoxybacillus flavithermus]MBE2943424.1 peroxiredoxin [Anoxybacillus flavithermus]MBE2951742.1 peroxiredoxin [Anoxybacillus flavithermus]